MKMNKRNEMGEINPLNRKKIQKFSYSSFTLYLDNYQINFQWPYQRITHLIQYKVFVFVEKRLQ